MKKGKRCGLLFTFCVSTLCLEKGIQSKCPHPASWHNFRRNCVTSLSSKRKQKRMRCLDISYPLDVCWKREIDADTLLQFLYPFSVFKKTSEIIWPAQLRDTITTGIVSRGCLQKGSRRGYDVYTCRIPSLPNKKGEPLRIHFYSFCIPSRLTKNIRSSFPCPASRHNYRGICVTRLSSKNEKKRMRVLHMSYSCTVWWKRVEVADSLLHFYTLGMHSLSSKNHLK